MVESLSNIHLLSFFLTFDPTFNLSCVYTVRNASLVCGAFFYSSQNKRVAYL